MKVVIFNVKYSENLGDGLLSECMTRVLEQEGVEVDVVDLAGRNSVGTNAGRGLSLKVLKSLPPSLRRLVVRLALKRKIERFKEDWRERIHNADGIILGGGNLFQDDDLNFPTKVGAVLELASETKAPLSIFSVGVTPDWSPRARVLFGRYQEAELSNLSFRDKLARDNWRKHFRSANEGILTLDPGLLTSQFFDKCVSCEPNTIGICVTAPDILTRHATQPARTIPLLSIGKYVELVRYLTAAGFLVRLFCNGAREDFAFAELVYKECKACDAADEDYLELVSRPSDISELVRVIGANSLIIAHRLHACICAHSFGIPTIGLGWDDKVKGFFEAVGREGFVVKDLSTPVEAIMGLVKSGVAEGVDPLHLGRQIAAARNDVIRAAAFSFRQATSPVKAEKLLTSIGAASSVIESRPIIPI
ncbi:polysaccharide pyruvyl transferase family protein [Rhizobium sp. Rhizsp82]|uniref:polysaccharide pyruvyl transferase family protein n=1 Tax=Rhizobium sp. Rhizsp82 TaxID=3243057 RepID=UPI0039B388E1